MACCLMAASHYLNQCWFTINETLYHWNPLSFTWRQFLKKKSDEESFPCHDRIRDISVPITAALCCPFQACTVPPHVLFTMACAIHSCSMEHAMLPTKSDVLMEGCHEVSNKCSEHSHNSLCISCAKFKFFIVWLTCAFHSCSMEHTMLPTKFDVLMECCHEVSNKCSVHSHNSLCTSCIKSKFFIVWQVLSIHVP